MQFTTTITIAGLFVALVLTGCDTHSGTSSPGAPAGQTPTAGSGGDSSASTTATSTAGKSGQTEAERTTLPSGLAYNVLKDGHGDSPQLGSAVMIHCVGRLENGQEFWNTRTAGVPQRVILTYDELIAGVLDMLLAMKPGERRQVHIPSELGYGLEGYPHKVPPRADLEIDLELVSIEP